VRVDGDGAGGRGVEGYFGGFCGLMCWIRGAGSRGDGEGKWG